MTSQNFLPPNLINEFTKADDKDIEENCLEGLFDRYHPEIIPVANRKQYHTLWLCRWHKIKAFENELLSLQDEIKSKNINIVLLKGMSFVHSLYPDLGSRYMSDIDLLVDEKSLNDLEIILISHGYHIVADSKWRANNFKKTFEKPHLETNLVIEAHTRLFFHISLPLVETLPWIHSPYKILSPEISLVHLVGHLAFSHTFIKFFWMIDIFKFISHHEKVIKWDYFFELIRKYHLQNSCNIVFFILNRYFEYHNPACIRPLTFLKKMIYKRLITFSFLMKNQNLKIRYFLIKHLTKDSYTEYIKYDFYWLMDYLKQKINWQSGSKEK